MHNFPIDMNVAPWCEPSDLQRPPARGERWVIWSIERQNQLEILSLAKNGCFFFFPSQQCSIVFFFFQETCSHLLIHVSLRDGFERWKRLADVGRTSCQQHRAAASCSSALGAHCVNDLRILLGRNTVALRPGRVFDTILKCQAAESSCPLLIYATSEHLQCTALALACS